MRIGLIIYGRLETLTGGYLYDRIVARGLTALGHSVEVVSLAGGPYLQRLGQGLPPALHRRLRTGRFDLLIQDELCHPSLFIVNQRLRRQAGPPVVALVHHILCKETRPRWRNMLLSIAERSFLASVDGFILNSETTRRTVAALVGHHRPQVVAYPAGDRFGSPPSADAIGLRARRPGPLELLFLGHVIPRKGLLPLLEALAGIDRDVWRLSVVGSLDFDPAHALRAKQLTRQLRLSESVRFLGPLPEEELVKILATSHLFCMPYAYEGFGIAILEAMAFGMPAIGCRDGAAVETIRHGTNGFLLRPGDLAGLAPLLAKVHRNRGELQRMALAARRTYINSPTWEDGVKAIDRFLQRMKDDHDRR
ncbi:MAG: glycosyltransferase family 4 protein [Desulfobacterales bacterium]|nr:glycosyltransferase family 4 protein [Desulfobacterales bacterium]